MYCRTNRGIRETERISYERINPLIVPFNDCSLYPTVKFSEVKPCQKHGLPLNFCSRCQIIALLMCLRRNHLKKPAKDIMKILFRQLVPSFSFILSPMIPPNNQIQCPQLLAYYIHDRMFVLQCHNVCSQAIDGLLLCHRHYESMKEELHIVDLVVTNRVPLRRKRRHRISGHALQLILAK